MPEDNSGWASVPEGKFNQDGYEWSFTNRGVKITHPSGPMVVSFIPYSVVDSICKMVVRQVTDHQNRNRAILDQKVAKLRDDLRTMFKQVTEDSTTLEAIATVLASIASVNTNLNKPS